MEKIKYLFLDLEWSQENDFDVKENQVLELAVAGFSDDFECQKRFARMVKPADVYSIPERTYQFLNISKERLIKEDTINVVLDKFGQKFPDYEVIVVWNENTYKLFAEKCRDNHICIPKHRLMVLQDIIASIDSKKRIYSMEKYLKKCGIQYKMNRLHYSKYDVERMRLLYLEIRKQYFNYLKGTPRKYYRSSSSNIIHVKSCHFIKRMVPEKRVLVEGRELLEGYSVCKCCRKNFPNIHFKAHKRSKQEFVDAKQCDFSDEYVYKSCRRYGLSCHISDGVIFVKSSIAAWRIYHNYEKVTEVLRYIYYHDKNYFSGKRVQKSNVEQLLEELERKRKCEGM